MSVDGVHVSYRFAAGTDQIARSIKARQDPLGSIDNCRLEVMQHPVSTSRQRVDLVNSGINFAEHSFCKGPHPIDDKPWVQTTLSRKKLPMPALGVFTPVLACNFLRQILCHAIPRRTAHHVIDRSQPEPLSRDQE